MKQFFIKIKANQMLSRQGLDNEIETQKDIFTMKVG